MAKKKSKKTHVTAATKKLKKTKTKQSASNSSLSSICKFWGSRLLVFGLVVLVGLIAILDIKIVNKFEGQKWALPAHVYTRPMELYLGLNIKRDLLKQELDELGYQPRDTADQIGTFSQKNNTFEIYQRSFRFWDGLQEAQLLSIQFNGDKISRLQSDGLEIEIVRLEPRLFGSISPLSHEDRSLLEIDEVPPIFIDALLAIEDRQFYSHIGINPLGIARAMLRNLNAGRVVQGGSTLTQQLVKNYYLNSDRTIKRKLIEMIMSLLLELHYSKEDILQAYLNEVYLSQAGNRAIHGFALGSQYFFGRPLQELELAELAMLAGIIKGPSYYNPIKHPSRAIQRRNLVLKTMLDVGSINDDDYQQAITTTLSTSPNTAQVAPLSYPAFVDLVRQNLRSDYQQQDLLNDGLQIHTTLDPRIQKSLELSVQKELGNIEKNRSLPKDSLQVAAAVFRTDNGEIAALLGDRKSSFSGFNRALQAQRPVGSLIKPFVYLTALESPENYSLASYINDEPIVVSQKGSPDWEPHNYDDTAHGQIMLIDALAKSYNLATVQLGMKLGVSNVVNTIHRLGYKRKIRELPSLLLGAVPMTVMDIGQLYLSLASGGFKTPIKSIRSVLNKENQPLSSYQLTVEQVVQPQFNNLINYALQEVVRSGTARRAAYGFSYDYGFAGKTGTTDDYRDSWFAGFSGNYLTVIWVGRDDNQPTGLTGATGAAKIWARTMQKIPLQRLELGYHDDIIQQRIFYSLRPEFSDCSLSRQLPILLSSFAKLNLPCEQQFQYDFDNEDERQHFEPRQKKRKSFWQRIFD